MKEDKLRQAILKDFKELLVKEFTTNWKAERFLIEMYLSVMSLDNTMKLINEQNQQLKAIEKEHQKINGELREEIKELEERVKTLKDTQLKQLNIIQQRDDVIEEVKRVLRCDDIAVLKYHGEPSETTSYEIVTIELLQILDKVKVSNNE